MGSLYSLSLLALLLVTFVDQICGSEVENEIYHRLFEGNETSVRQYEPELETILRSILKNGIPDFGIPPLDPLVYKDTISISETVIPGMMTIEYLELGDIEVVGLSTFVNNSLLFEPFQLKVSLDFTFPIELKAERSNFSIIIGDLLPFKGEGPANLIADLRVKADIQFMAVSPPVLYLLISSLSGDIFFYELEVEFDSLMGVTGGKETRTLNKLIGDVTPEIIDLMKPYMIDGILESLKNTANEFLDSLKIRLKDLLECILGTPDCPFELP